MGRAALLVGCIASLSIACGGKSDSDVFDDGSNDGTGGTSAGGTGGTASNGSGGSGGGNGSTSSTNGSSSNVSSAVTTGGTVTTGSTTGNSTTGNATTGNTTTRGSTTGTGTTGSGGGPSDRCLLPIEPGPCEGAFEAYGYDTETGRCEKFIYGGCEGNDNRFDTITECLGLCAPAGLACENNSDCAVDHDCCGACGLEDPEELVAVNAKYATFAAPECFLLDCAICLPSQEIANYGARCNKGSCEVYDVRESDVSACEVDADCRLRAGLGCCETCGESAWVAVSTDHERVQKELCGDMDAVCPPCAPAQPENLEALCGAEGHCLVGTRID